VTQKVQILRSNTPGHVPAAGSLLPGELAVNMPDKRLFYGDSSGNPQDLLETIAPIVGLFQKDGNYGAYSTTDQALHRAHVTINSTEPGPHTGVDSALIGGQFVVHGSEVPSSDPVTCNWIGQFSMIKAGWPATTVRGELDGLSIITRNAIDDTSAFIANVGTTDGFGVVLEGVTSQFDTGGAQLRSVRVQLAAIEGGLDGPNYSLGAVVIAEKGEHDVGLQIQSTSIGLFDTYLKCLNQLGHVFFGIDGFGNIGIANFANTQNIVIGIDNDGSFSVKNTGSVLETFAVDQSGVARAHGLTVAGTDDMGTAWTADTVTPTPLLGTFTLAGCTRRTKKIGRTVHVQLLISITTNGTATGGIMVPLPYAAAAVAVLPGREVTVSGKAVTGTVHAADAVLTVFADLSTYPGGDGTDIVLTGIYEAAS
jgi:hypothetical protein